MGGDIHIGPGTSWAPIVSGRFFIVYCESGSDSVALAYDTGVSCSEVNVMFTHDGRVDFTVPDQGVEAQYQFFADTKATADFVVGPQGELFHQVFQKLSDDPYSVGCDRSLSWSALSGRTTVLALQGRREDDVAPSRASRRPAASCRYGLEWFQLLPD